MTSETMAARDHERATEGALSTTPYLICRVGQQLHAIPIEHVVEIMRALPIEPVANAPSYIRGVCIVRGNPTPVIDTGLLVGGQQTNSRRLVEIKTEKRLIVLLVEDVLGIRLLQDGRYKELPPLLRDVASETVAGIGMLDAALLLILNVTKVVSEELFQEIEQAEARP